MSFPKILIASVLVLFGLIGVVAVMKRGDRSASYEHDNARQQEISLGGEVVEQEPLASSNVNLESTPLSVVERPLPDADRMDEFFNVGEPKLPIVETIVYKRKVPWLEGKAAWVVDYASHYDTSRHFIARSLNGCRNYDDQRVANGDCFNVFKKECPVNFHLVVDTSRCKMWVYYYDEAANQRVLVKTYPVGLGREEEKRASGLLTPYGQYTLGENIGVYREGSMGSHNGERIEMRQVFGTRWIPFDQEIGSCTAPSKGLGLHGCPWNDQGQEDRSGLGSYASDGCIRLATEDMEELFSVVITKPTTIHIVPDFFEAQLPGEE